MAGFQQAVAFSKTSRNSRTADRPDLAVPLLYGRSWREYRIIRKTSGKAHLWMRFI